MNIPLAPGDQMQFMEMDDERKQRFKAALIEVMRILREKVNGPLEAYAVLQLGSEYLKEHHGIKAAIRINTDDDRKAGN